MKATCPNDPNHKKFINKGTLAVDVMVDENGKFLEVAEGEWEFIGGVNVETPWQCTECACLAEVE
jgi:3-deoxy-D-arabino-heptulosonate 7-phosphate (DAHP) synthase class II